MSVVRKYKTFVGVFCVVAMVFCCVGFAWPYCRSRYWSPKPNIVCTKYKGDEVCVPKSSVRPGFPTHPRQLRDENQFSFQDLP